MIDVMLLGTGAMVPLPKRWLSSALVRSGSSLVLLDCGEGTQISMRQRHWGFRKLDAICLSHLHADHVAGVPGLLHTVAHAGKTTPLAIYGPVGTIEVMEGLRTIARAMPYDLVIHELADGDAVAGPGDLRIRVALGEHRVPVIGYRLERDRQPRFSPEKAQALGVPINMWSVLQRGEPVEHGGTVIEPGQVVGEQRKGIALGFVTDTRPTAGLRELVRDVDLLIAEGTYGNDDDIDKARSRGHMTFRESARFARDVGVGHLWLTHFSAGMDDPLAWRQNASDELACVTVGHAGLGGRLNFDTGYEEVSSDLAEADPDLDASQ